LRPGRLLRPCEGLSAPRSVSPRLFLGASDPLAAVSPRPAAWCSGSRVTASQPTPNLGLHFDVRDRRVVATETRDQLSNGCVMEVARGQESLADGGRGPRSGISNAKQVRRRHTSG
jgi:hypothetical protein